MVRVGKGGRGFIIAAGLRRFVITAAHCLPRLPPANVGAYGAERTFRRLLGPLSARRRTVWVECAFVDPVADIAVLSEPDDQELFDEYEAYVALTKPVEPFAIGVLNFVQERRQLSNGHTICLPPRAKASGQMISLDRRWFACEVKSTGGRFAWVDKPDTPIEGGMSGSPILGADGAAIGVVCASNSAR